LNLRTKDSSCPGRLQYVQLNGGRMGGEGGRVGEGVQGRKANRLTVEYGKTGRKQERGVYYLQDKVSDEGRERDTWTDRYDRPTEEERTSHMKCEKEIRLRSLSLVVSKTNINITGLFKS